LRGGFAAILFAVSALALLPVGAGAATICVGISGCGASAATLQAALDAAKATTADDRVVVGAGRFEGPFTYLPGADGGALDLVGQGEDTILTAPGGASAITILRLARDAAGHAANVSDLSVHAPINTTPNNPGNVGIQTSSAVSRVKVAFDANDVGGNNVVGVLLSAPGGVVRDSEIEMPLNGGFTPGVQVQGEPAAAPALITGSRIVAPTGISASASTTVVRSRVISGRNGIEACNTAVTAEDSLVRVLGTGKGLEVEGDNRCGGAQSSITARHLTIVGSGVLAGQTGALVTAGVGGQNPTLDLTSSIVRDVQTAFRTQTGVIGVATTRVGASDFEVARHTETSGGGGTALFQQSAPNIDADPLFTDPLAGNFALLPGSPAIDTGLPTPLAAGESATDLAGGPRILDGNGDGVARRDMGAFEAPAIAPPPAPDRTAPETKIKSGPKAKVKVKGHRKAGVIFAFESSEAGSSFQCKLDKAQFAPCSTPFKAQLKVASHIFQVRAIDAAGNVDPTPATRTVNVVRKKSGKHGSKKHPGRSRGARP
jgi:hypothetical protein